jgi:hypothetical protein
VSLEGFRPEWLREAADQTLVTTLALVDPLDLIVESIPAIEVEVRQTLEAALGNWKHRPPPEQADGQQEAMPARTVRTDTAGCQAGNPVRSDGILQGDNLSIPDDAPPTDLAAFPLGVNPFPQGHPVSEVFIEATWKAKEQINRFQSELLQTPGSTPTEFLQSILTFRKRWFSVCAYEATNIVGNEATALWYERWIDEWAGLLIEDTLSGLRRRDPKANPGDSPFFSAKELESFENDLTLELMKMIAHYKGVASRRVQESFQLLKAKQAAAASGLDTEKQGESVDPAGVRDAKPAVPLTGDLPTVADVEAALNRGDRKKAVILRCKLENCKINTLWRSAFELRAGTGHTKRTAFNRWQASRRDAPSWADELMRLRLLK